MVLFELDLLMHIKVSEPVFRIDQLQKSMMVHGASWCRGFQHEDLGDLWFNWYSHGTLWTQPLFGKNDSSKSFMIWSTPEVQEGPCCITMQRGTACWSWCFLIEFEWSWYPLSTTSPWKEQPSDPITIWSTLEVQEGPWEHLDAEGPNMQILVISDWIGMVMTLDTLWTKALHGQVNARGMLNNLLNSRGSKWSLCAPWGWSLCAPWCSC